MDPVQEKQALQEKLARCRRIARSLDDDVTVRNLLDLAGELEHKIRMLDDHDAQKETARRSGPFGHQSMTSTIR
jgi:hypothetical protein